MHASLALSVIPGLSNVCAFMENQCVSLLVAIHPPETTHSRHLGLTLFPSAKSLAISLLSSLPCILQVMVTMSPKFSQDRVCVSVFCFAEIF